MADDSPSTQRRRWIWLILLGVQTTLSYAGLALSSILLESRPEVVLFLRTSPDMVILVAPLVGASLTFAIIYPIRCLIHYAYFELGRNFGARPVRWLTGRAPKAQHLRSSALLVGTCLYPVSVVDVTLGAASTAPRVYLPLLFAGSAVSSAAIIALAMRTAGMLTPVLSWIVAHQTGMVVVVAVLIVVKVLVRLRRLRPSSHEPEGRSR
ncbi:hypothetical protein [Micromonospora ureilytica]|uniref:hypothetical protein n=1 Tax=Micromonospora ureilytica TaxID=709868 RepID=UPI004039F3F7